MNIIIPACGEGKRFNKKCKPLIKILDKEMICYVIDNLSYTENDNIFIIYNNPLLEKIYKKYSNIKMIKLDKKTKGAAETLMEGLSVIFTQYHFYDKTLVLDCDTFYTEDIVGVFRKSNTNTIFYRHRENEPHIYSYITMDSQNVVTDIKEKVKISDYAATGALGFVSTVSLFENCKNIVSKGINYNGECYTSLAVKRMLKTTPFYGYQLKRVFSLGTPEEVRTYIHNSYFFLFDLDGTLIRTDHIYRRVWSEILKSHDIQLTEPLYQQSIQGNTDAHALLSLGIHIEDIKTLKDDLFMRYLDEVQMIEGAISFLNRLKKRGHKFCIVTNSNRRVAEAIIKRHSLNPDFIITSEDCVNGKPSPEPYIAAMKKYGKNYSNDRCIIFEDSVPGMVSARNTNPRLLVGIETLFSEEEIAHYGADISFSDYTTISISKLLNSKNNIYRNIRNDITNTTGYDGVIIEQNKLKGGFIADVLSIKLKDRHDVISCVLKHDSTIKDTDISFMAEVLRLCEREYYFYQTIYPWMNIPVPKCMGTINTDNIHHGILLENMFNRGYKVNVDLNKENIELSLTIIDCMAKMHSKFWNNIDQFSELKRTTDPAFRPFMKEYINQRIDQFINKWSFMIEDNIGLYVEAANDFSEVQKMLSEGNLTLVHGDIKSPNIFYGNIKEDVRDICFIDWQHCIAGKGTQDLIFFLIESFDVDKIAEYYPIFTQHYYNSLVTKLIETGINYDYKEYLLDIRNSIRYVPFFTIVWFGTVPDEELIDKDFPTNFLNKLNTLFDIFSDETKIVSDEAKDDHDNYGDHSDDTSKSDC